MGFAGRAGNDSPALKELAGEAGLVSAQGGHKGRPYKRRGNSPLTPVRAFIAIELPEAIQTGLGQEQVLFRAACRSQRHDDIRWTRPQSFHLTLKFLGEISAQRVNQVTEALRTLGPFEPFSVEVKGFGCFPDFRRPRVLWAGISAPPELERLSTRVDDAMAILAFPREARTLTPHLTLARLRTPRLEPALQSLLASHAGEGLGQFNVSEFFLFESKLSPRGAEYTRVARFP